MCGGGGGQGDGLPRCCQGQVCSAPVQILSRSHAAFEPTLTADAVCCPRSQLGDWLQRGTSRRPSLQLPPSSLIFVFRSPHLFLWLDYFCFFVVISLRPRHLHHMTSSTSATTPQIYETILPLWAENWLCTCLVSEGCWKETGNNATWTSSVSWGSSHGKRFDVFVRLSKSLTWKGNGRGTSCSALCKDCERGKNQLSAIEWQLWLSCFAPNQFVCNGVAAYFWPVLHQLVLMPALLPKTRQRKMKRSMFIVICLHWANSFGDLHYWWQQALGIECCGGEMTLVDTMQDYFNYPMIVYFPFFNPRWKRYTSLQSTYLFGV